VSLRIIGAGKKEKRIRRVILVIGILTVLLCTVAESGWAVQGEGPSEVHEVDSAEVHSASVSGHGDNIPIPFMYKLYWIGLISMMILIMLYFFLFYRKENYQSLKSLTILLILLAFSLYLLEQGRVFTGYFDPVRHVFVSGYHEANNMGFLRFIYKLVLGIALCGYGFSNFLSRQRDKKESINLTARPSGD
jgi:uncharacterized membrane protein